MNRKKQRQAQASIEYVAGFLFFLVAILFVVFNVLDKLPQYYEESHNTLLHETVWLASQKAMIFSAPNGDFNMSAIDVFSQCTLYTLQMPNSEAFVNGWNNYTVIKASLGIESKTDFRMNVKSFEILVSNESIGTNYTGTFNISGSQGVFEIFNYSFGTYDGIHIGNSYSKKGELVEISSINYYVELIDPSGNFAILSKTHVDCGRHAFRGKTTAAAKRYATYNGSLAMMELILWE